MVVDNGNTRSSYLDIVKAFAIICVVFGHCIQYGSGNSFLKNDLFLEDIVFKVIYSFHMPLFMLISGYLFAYSSKNKKWMEVIINRVKTLIIPILSWYLIPSVVVVAYVLVSKKGAISTSLENYISTATSNMWFLWAVFWCSLLVIIVRHFFKDSKWVYLIIFLFSFLVTDAMYLNLYKFMYPYFVLGYFYQKEDGPIKLKKIYSYNYTIIVFGILFIGLLFFYDWDAYIYTTGHCVRGKGILRQTIIDMYRYGIGLIGSILVLLVFNKIKNKFVGKTYRIMKNIGINTMGIYIVSGFVFSYVLGRITQNLMAVNYFLTIVETVIILVFTLICTHAIKKNKYLNRFLLGGRI